MEINTNHNIAEEIASQLLAVEAVFLRPQDPFTWASGIKSPIYCDNRITLSYPKLRNLIRDAFIQTIKNELSHVEVIAGVATAGIPQASIIANQMNLPLIYVRPEAKDHGRNNQIEGKLEPGTNVVVIEDLLSTGSSSLKAIQALEEAGANVLGLVAIFSYELSKLQENFTKAKIPYYTLSNYPVLIDLALKTGRISEEDYKLLQDFRTRF